MNFFVIVRLGLNPNLKFKEKGLDQSRTLNSLSTTTNVQLYYKLGPSTSTKLIHQVQHLTFITLFKCTRHQTKIQYYKCRHSSFNLLSTSISLTFNLWPICVFETRKFPISYNIPFFNMKQKPITNMLLTTLFLTLWKAGSFAHNNPRICSA